jgi:hypothetical protein
MPVIGSPADLLPAAGRQQASGREIKQAVAGPGSMPAPSRSTAESTSRAVLGPRSRGRLRRGTRSGCGSMSGGLPNRAGIVLSGDTERRAQTDSRRFTGVGAGVGAGGGRTGGCRRRPHLPASRRRGSTGGTRDFDPGGAVHQGAGSASAALDLPVRSPRSDVRLRQLSLLRQYGRWPIRVGPCGRVGRSSESAGAPVRQPRARTRTRNLPMWSGSSMRTMPDLARV